MSRVTSPLLADERQSYFEVDEDDEEWVMEEDDEEVWEENPPSLKRQTSYGVPETSLNKPRGLRYTIYHC